MTAKRQQAPKPEPLLTVAQAAELLGCWPQAVYNLINTRQIACVRPPGIGTRLRPAVVEQFIKDHEQPATGTARLKSA